MQYRRDSQSRQPERGTGMVGNKVTGGQEINGVSMIFEADSWKPFYGFDQHLGLPIFKHARFRISI